MRAVGYIGPPCAIVNGGACVSAAIDSMERFCSESGHYLHKVFGTQAEIRQSNYKKTYQSLVDYFSGVDGQPALVLLPDSSHLASGLVELVHRLIALESVGAEVKCTNTNTTDPLQSGLLLLGAYEPLKPSQKRAREAIISKAERGEVLGRTPFGYQSGLDGTLKPKPTEACIVRNIFAWYTGAKDPNTFNTESQIGARKIAALLNIKGTLTRSSGYWTPATVAALLRNRVYVGTYSRFGVIIGSNHAPIVDRNIFDTAQQLIRDRRPIRTPATQIPFLLSNLTTCGVCGRKLIGLTRKRSWQRADGSKTHRVYRYYHCPSRTVRSSLRNASQHSLWRAETLEAQVRKKIKQLGRLRNLDQRVPAAPTDTVVKQELRAVEREFVRAVRSVASGTGGLMDLKNPLEVLRSTLQKTKIGTGEVTKAELVVRALNSNTLDSGKAIAALTEDISVKNDHIDISFRKGTVS